MSYILDALRKSDEERRKKSGAPISSGLSFERRSVSRQRRTAFSLILVSCMLIAVLIMAFGLWWSQRYVQHSPVPVPEDQPAHADSAAAGLAPPAAALEAAPELPAITAPRQNTMTEPVARSGGQTAPVPKQEPNDSDLQKRLPELHFSGHVYSAAPELRMIMINNLVFREGQHIDADLSLIEITETGVILSFKGSAYQIELF